MEYIALLLALPRRREPQHEIKSESPPWSLTVSLEEDDAVVVDGIIFVGLLFVPFADSQIVSRYRDLGGGCDDADVGAELVWRIDEIVACGEDDVVVDVRDVDVEAVAVLAFC